MTDEKDAHGYNKVGTLPFHLLVFGQKSWVFLVVHSHEKYNDGVDIDRSYDRQEDRVIVQNCLICEALNLHQA